MTHCPQCLSERLRTTVAGLDWLVECLTCSWWKRLTDEELAAS